MKIITAILLLIILLNGCVHLKGDLNFNSLNSTEAESVLKLNGIYLRNSYLRFGLRLSGVMVFHQNGVVSCETTLNEEDATCEGVKRIFDKWTSRDFHEVKEIWGTYNIKGDLIKIQIVIPSSVGIFGAFYEVGEKHGRILSDTTFVLTEFHTRKDVSDINEVYKFYPCDFKPDSSNFPFKDQ